MRPNQNDVIPAEAKSGDLVERATNFGKIAAEFKVCGWIRGYFMCS
jgi:hypothetical protein